MMTRWYLSYFQSFKRALFEKYWTYWKFFCPKYNTFLLSGDVKLEKKKPNLFSKQNQTEFLSNNDAKNLAKSKTCFKNLLNPQWIDLFNTNSICRFQKAAILGRGLSDFHKINLTVLKSTFEKSNSKKIVHRNYKKFEKAPLRIIEKENYSVYLQILRKGISRCSE